MAGQRARRSPTASDKPAVPMTVIAVVAQAVGQLVGLSLCFALASWLGVAGRTAVMWPMYAGFSAAFGVLVAILGTVPVKQQYRVTMPLLREFSAGNLTARIPVRGRDEIGFISNAINEAITNLAALVSGARASAEALTGTSTTLRGASERFGANADQCTADASDVMTAATRITTEIDALAEKSADLSGSIGEIARTTETVTTSTRGASVRAGTTRDLLDELRESASEIGAVVNAISLIADQTNMLALNATIEAARAGEAGKGFAVVANDIKDLAHMTASATETIAGQVASIQTDAADTVVTVNDVIDTIANITDRQMAIASSVEQQLTITSAITARIGTTVVSNRLITENMREVETSARDTAGSAAALRQALGDLDAVAGELGQICTQYRS